MTPATPLTVTQDQAIVDPYQTYQEDAVDSYQPYQETAHPAGEAVSHVEAAWGPPLPSEAAVVPVPAGGGGLLCRAETALAQARLASSLIMTGPRFKFPSKLKQMRTMGFGEEEGFLRGLLTRTTGRVEVAVEEICSPRRPPPRPALAMVPAQAANSSLSSAPTPPAKLDVEACPGVVGGIVVGQGRRASIGGA